MKGGYHTKVCWAVRWHTKEGPEDFIIDNYLAPCLFLSRKSARRFIAENYEYVKLRKDLRQPPHNWRMPKAVKVRVQTQVLG